MVNDACRLRVVTIAARGGKKCVRQNHMPIDASIFAVDSGAQRNPEGPLFANCVTQRTRRTQRAAQERRPKLNTNVR
jgi:hypothetical protein